MPTGRIIGRVAAGLLLGFWLTSGTATPTAPPSAAAKLNLEARSLLRSDPNQAQALAQQALLAAQRDLDVAAEVGARINLGAVERQRGRHDQAVIEFERAVALARDLPQRKLYADALANLGISLDLGGLYAEALQVQGEALAIYEAEGETARLSAVLINLGNTLDNLGDAERAREHYQRALDTKRANGIDKGLGAVLNNLADLALTSGTTEQAITLLDQAIAAHEREGDRVGLGLALSNRGIAKARSGRFDAAFADIQQGEAIARELEHALGSNAALRARAEAWLLRAKSLEGDPHQYALLNAEREARAAVIGSDGQDPERRLRAKRLLAGVLAERGDAVAALAMMDEIEQESTRLRNARDDGRIAVVRARYQNQREASDLALLRERAAKDEAELARSRILLRSALGGAIAAVIAIGLLISLARERRLRAEVLRAQEAALRAALARAEQESARAILAAGLNQRLLAMAGDDLQAPLTDIRGTAERLLSMPNTPPDMTRPLAAIARHASDLMQIVLRMRESARADHETAEASIDFSSLLDGCRDDMEARARQRQQRLHWQIAPQIMVRGRADDLLGACTQLLEHTIRLNPADCAVEVRLQVEDGRAVLSLSDRDGALSAVLVDAPRGANARRASPGLLRESLVRINGEISSVAADAPDTGQVLRIMLPLDE